MSRTHASLALAATVTALMACGPSFQAIYECDVRFEHCYALDETDASKALKRQCWGSWLQGYTYGQPRDRVDFATARYAQLDPDGTGPRPDAGRPPPPPAVDALVPANAFAPPPNVASSIAGLDAAAPMPPPPRPPGDACLQECAAKWNVCRSDCRGDACVACTLSYRECVLSCVQ